MLLVMMVFPGRISFNAAHVAFNAGLIGPGHAGLWTTRLVADLPLTHDALEESVDRVHVTSCQSTCRGGRHVPYQKHVLLCARPNVRRSACRNGGEYPG